MANKEIKLNFTETGITSYSIIKQESSGNVLDSNDGTFKSYATAVDPWINLTEHANIKGLYEATIASVFSNGRYTVSAYKQSGGSPVPASDKVIGSGDLYILSDTEVFLDASLASVDAKIDIIDTNVDDIETMVKENAFMGFVTIDANHGSAGTAYPLGTRLNPVNNFTDALAIATTYGIESFYIRGTVTIGALESISGYTFEADADHSAIVLNGSSTLNTEFRGHIGISGTINGHSHYYNSHLSAGVSGLCGFFEDCLFDAGTFTLGTSYSNIVNCSFANANIDVTVAGSILNMYGCAGNVTIANKTGAETFNIEMETGTLILNTTCIAGTVNVRGLPILTNNATIGCTVNDSTVLSILGTPVSVDGSAISLAGMIKKMLDDAGGVSYDATLHSLKAIKDAVVAGQPLYHTSIAGTITFGTNVSGSYTDTYLDNNIYWTIAPVAVNGLSIILDFNVTTSRVATNLHINGHFDAHVSRFTEVYAYNYTTTVWDIISNASTRLNHSTSDLDYNYTILSQHTEVGTGNCRIRFVSASVTTGDRLYLDELIVTSNESAAGGLTAALIAQAVWRYNVNVHEGIEDAAQHYLHSLRIFHGDITASNTALSFTVGTLPATANYYQGYICSIHKHDLSEHAESIIESHTSGGVITLRMALPFIPQVADHMTITRNANILRTIETEVLTHPTLTEIEASTVIAKEANVETHVTNSLNTYDPPTRAELTSDKDSIIAEVNANETKIDSIIGYIDSEITSIISAIAALQADVGDPSVDVTTLYAQVLAVKAYVDDLETRLTATRAGYLDNLSGGATALNSTVAKEATLTNVTYGLSALKDLLDAIDTSTELAAKFTEIKGTGWTTETLKVIKDTIAGGGISVEAIADAVWDEAISGHTVSTTFGGKNQKVVPSESVNDYKADVSGLALESGIETHVTNSLNTYDPPTRSELTTDKNSIISEIDSNEAKIDIIDTNVDAIKAKTDTISWSNITDLRDEAFGKWVLDPILKTLTLYRTDNVTVLKVFNLTDTSLTVPAFVQRTPV